MHSQPTALDAVLAADPFSDWVFREPRQPCVSVGGLNDRALGRLLFQFKRLSALPVFDSAATGGYLVPPPPRGLEPAQLVVSPQPGFGKSHLVGRLFAALEGRATLVSVTPFQCPDLAWQSVLLHTVQELAFPDRAAPMTTAAGEPATQLDLLAHAVLAQLIAGLIDGRHIRHADPVEAVSRLRENPLEALALADPDHPWSRWLHDLFATFRGELSGELRRVGVSMHSPGWLRVLFTYASAQPGAAVRAWCLAWLRGETLPPAAAAELGLGASEISPVELPGQVNELCRRRLLDLCRLAGFYRPFVFCFDQTEVYGDSPALARAFGALVAHLHLSASHHLMVVTANQSAWEETVARAMEPADRDRFVPLVLDGLNRAQAAELVRQRCAEHAVPDAVARAFFDPVWLAARFPSERNRMGIRPFLQACSARWRQPEGWWQSSSALDGVERPEPATPIVPYAPVLLPAPEPQVVRLPRRDDDDGAVPSLHDLFNRYADTLRCHPRRLGYNPDAFRWLTEEAARSVPGLSAGGNVRNPRGYLPVRWTGQDDGEGEVFIGFEPGDSWKRWRSILREAEECCCVPVPVVFLTQAVSDTSSHGKAVFFRTTDQPPIPGARWTIADEVIDAKARYLDVIELDEGSTAELYAARTLYLDAAAGDLPYQAGEVLDFLATELAPFWQRVLQPL